LDGALKLYKLKTQKKFTEEHNKKLDKPSIPANALHGSMLEACIHN
jgi:hypothetical protein